MKVTSIIHLLVLTVGFTISMLLFRIFYSGSFLYIFLGWNLFLASIPLGATLLLIKTKNKNLQWMLFAGWLLFFPNALYIVTDLVHLKSRYPVPIWYDIILIFSAAVNGLIMAFISLRHIEIFLRSKFNQNKTVVILFGCLFLSSFGVYLGRFLRWNSWDILLDPLGLLNEIVQRFINPSDHPHTWSMTIVLSIFFTVFYYTIKNVPKLISRTNFP